MLLEEAIFNRQQELALKADKIARRDIEEEEQAEAGHIKITASKGRLLLRIQDDGKGIPSDALATTANGSQGVGLSRMRERSTLLGGTFDVETNSSGPGLITGASDDDPSDIATYSPVAAQFGYTLRWTTILSYPLMAAIPGNLWPHRPCDWVRVGCQSAKRTIAAWFFSSC